MFLVGLWSLLMYYLWTTTVAVVRSPSQVVVEDGVQDGVGVRKELSG